MRAVIAMLGAALAGCGGAESGVVLELSSDVVPLDGISFTVLGDTGALVLDQPIRDGDQALGLPRTVLIASGPRQERIRVLVWGLRATERVAFGAVTAELVAGEESRLSLRLGAPPADCDGDAVPDLLDGCPAIPDPTQDDADGDGVSDACTPGAGCPANLLANPGFEDGTAGWQASTANPGVLSRVDGGASGAFAGQLCKQASGGAAEYAMDDRPDAVTATKAGARYRADAWVRSVSAGAQRIDLRIGEFTLPDLTPLGSRTGSVIGSADWQVVSTTYTVGDPGSTLDTRFRVLAAPDGACFQLDDVCLQELAPGCP